MSTKLILIRHGATAWNKQKRYCGFIDVALSPSGRGQARLLHKRLKGEIIHKVYSSDRKRALETARIVFKGADIEIIPDMREMNFGCFEGLTHGQILKKYPLVYKKWLKDPYAVSVPFGEFLPDFKKRVVAALKNIVARHPSSTIAVVCHGGAISVFLTDLLKTRDFWKHIPKSASMSTVEYKGKKPRIIAVSDTEHLNRIK